MPIGLEEWAAVIDYWTIVRGRDIGYLDIPPDITAALLLTNNGETMTDVGQTPSGEPPAEIGRDLPKWKRKAYFDGTECGYSGCSKPAVGYNVGLKPTKGGARGLLWYGPACDNHDLRPTTLAELAHQRAGASDLALVLDVEVGDVLKRLAAAGIDEKGRPVSTLQQQADQDQAAFYDADPHLTDATTEPLMVVRGRTVDARMRDASRPLPLHTIVAEPIQLPVQYLADRLAYAQGVLQQLAPWQIQSQPDMDYAAGFLAQVKGMWNEVEEQRKTIVKPLRDKIKSVQDYFKPALELLTQVEVLMKLKITEGNHRAQAAQQAAYEAAQRAMGTGDQQGAALATQQAVAADIALPTGVQIRSEIAFEIIDYTQLPQDFWSWVPDPAKIQAAVDAGWRQIPGVRIFEKSVVASRSA